MCFMDVSIVLESNVSEAVPSLPFSVRPEFPPRAGSLRRRSALRVPPPLNMRPVVLAPYVSGVNVADVWALHKLRPTTQFALGLGIETQNHDAFEDFVARHPWVNYASFGRNLHSRAKRRNRKARRGNAACRVPQRCECRRGA